MLLSVGYELLLIGLGMCKELKSALPWASSSV